MTILIDKTKEMSIIQEKVVSLNSQLREREEKMSQSTKFAERKGANKYN